LQTANVKLARHKALSLLVFSLLLVLLAPAANAVTKHLSMLDGNGKPLVSTKITITYPDGSSANALTDDKGILQYNFKQTGEYTLSDPAGNVVKTISVAGGGVNSKLLTITAVAAGAALLLVAAGSGGDSDSGGDQPEEPGGPEGEIAGIYNVTASIANNPGDLPVLIDTLVLQFEIIGTQLTIIQTSSNPNFPSQLSGTIAGESFTASSNGIYGDVKTLFQLAGSISASQPLSFLINIGSDGSFPDGQIITYNATGTK
jgi:hypothetical protein